MLYFAEHTIQLESFYNSGFRAHLGILVFGHPCTFKTCQFSTLQNHNSDAVFELLYGNRKNQGFLFLSAAKTTKMKLSVSKKVIRAYDTLVENNCIPKDFVL